MTALPLHGYTVLTLESRRQQEMSTLLARRGATVLSAPSMREIPLEDQAEALAFGDQLFRGECEILLLLTGVGTQMLVDALATKWPHEEVVAALQKVRLFCRGPKPHSVCKQLGLRPEGVAPEPNTWREILPLLEQAPDTQGKRVFIQEYGITNTALMTALRDMGLTPVPVPVYAWQLPSDVEPLEHAVRELAQRKVDALVFTSGHQFFNLKAVAETQGVWEQLKQALQDHVVVASVGPVTTEVLHAEGLNVDLEPEHPKMGHLANALTTDLPRCVQNKRAPTQS